LGKILRIDVDSTPDEGLAYHVPEDNPFYNESSWSGRREVWAWGTRNPWRCSFEHGGEERLLCGDVGQETREEVNLIQMGNDYGWSEMEGTWAPPQTQGQPSALLTPPILEYDHMGVMGGSPAAIGGYIYWGPTEQCAPGAYLFADWQGIALQFNLSSNLWHRRTIYIANGASVVSYPGIGRIMSLGVDYTGTLYYIASMGVYRLVDRSVCGLPAACPSEDSLDTLYALNPFGVKEDITSTPTTAPPTTSPTSTTTADTTGSTSNATTTSVSTTSSGSTTTSTGATGTTAKPTAPPKSTSPSPSTATTTGKTTSGTKQSSAGVGMFASSAVAVVVAAAMTALMW